MGSPSAAITSTSAANLSHGCAARRSAKSASVNARVRVCGTVPTRMSLVEYARFYRNHSTARAPASPPPLAAELGSTRVRPPHESAEVGNIRLRLEGQGGGTQKDKACVPPPPQ